MIWLSSILIVLLVIWLFVAIYTKDKPKIIPEETRGDIRKGIEEQIARPIESLVPSIGKAMIAASYSNNVTVSQNVVDNNNVAQVSNNYSTYKSDEYGFEITYPKDWHYEEQNLIDLPAKTEKVFSLDPTSTDKTVAQIFIEISSENQYQAENRVTANISNVIESTVTVGGMAGKKYKGELLELGTGNVLGNVIYTILSKNNHTYIISYNTNRTNPKNLLSEYNNILNNFEL